MLTLNIPKLSGHCGKLICCLLYEDDMYSEAKKDFPRYGTVVHDGDLDYTVDGFNILSRSVKLSNPTDVKFVSLDDYNAIARRSYKPTATTSAPSVPPKNNGSHA
jgi:cell fate regulator YaaT (PSP1 superfamily)